MTRAATVRVAMLAVALVLALGALAWVLRTGPSSSAFDPAAATGGSRVVWVNGR